MSGSGGRLLSIRRRTCSSRVSERRLLGPTAHTHAQLAAALRRTPKRSLRCTPAALLTGFCRSWSCARRGDDGRAVAARSGRATCQPPQAARQLTFLHLLNFCSLISLLPTAATTPPPPPCTRTHCHHRCPPKAERHVAPQNNPPPPPPDAVASSHRIPVLFSYCHLRLANRWPAPRTARASFV